MSKSQERRLEAQMEGATVEELRAELATLAYENRTLWETINNLMDIRGSDLNEQLARLSGGTESGDSE